jgi:hypothetical protein
MKSIKKVDRGPIKKVIKKPKASDRYKIDTNYKFQFFRDDGSTYWESFLYKAKCIGKLDDGRPCEKYTTRVHPYCYQCMIRTLHVSIRESLQGPGSGLGLFAYDPLKGENDIIFKKDDFIAPYCGEEVSEDDLVERYTGISEDEENICCAYAIGTSDDQTVDAALIRGPAAFCNDSKVAEYNAVLAEIPHLGLLAIKDIRNNEEILASYGDECMLLIN